ncbi:hypothetical protein [uncultured Clostridium sp.]|uniref:hypothetical protein n=1 Tax=uncultured Clostridium sp. TaxID=59620 RepID=UPI003217F747
MVIKLKEGCLVNLQDIKIAKVYSPFGDEECGVNIEIQYYDEKKNPKAYISCENKNEAIELVDKLLEEINNSKKLKMW